MGLIQQFLKGNRETDEMEPGLIQKADGTVWLVNPDGSETQLGGGGPTAGSAEITGGIVGSCDSGDDFLASWVRVGGAVLLDYTDPTQPTVIAAGLYAVFFDCSAITPMTPGGWFEFDLTMDPDGIGGEVASHVEATAANPNPLGNVGFVQWVPAGGKLTSDINNNDGVKNIEFSQGGVVTLIG